MYKQLKARSNQFSAKIISILGTINIIARNGERENGGTGERGNGRTGQRENGETENGGTGERKNGERENRSGEWNEESLKAEIFKM